MNVAEMIVMDNGFRRCLISVRMDSGTARRKIEIPKDKRASWDGIILRTARLCFSSLDNPPDKREQVDYHYQNTCDKP
jgi:hypothetical protein